MVCINLICCDFSTDSQAAAGQAAGPGSAGGWRLSREDSGDQAWVRAVIAAPPFTALTPRWPIHSLSINLLSTVEQLRGSGVSCVTLIKQTVLCYHCSFIWINVCVFLLYLESSRTKTLWVRSCRTLSMTLRSVTDRWIPRGSNRPLTSPDSGVDRLTRRCCNFHLLSCTYRSPAGSTLLAAAVLLHPGDFSHSGSVFLSVVLCCVNACLSKNGLSCNGIDFMCKYCIICCIF